MSWAHGGEKRPSDAMGLEFQTVVSHLVVAGNQTQGPLREQLVCLAPEPSLEPQLLHTFWDVVSAGCLLQKVSGF